MAKDVIMPVLGMNQDTALLVSWLAREGDAVVEGEPLMEVETDKAVMELDAPASGTLIDVTATEGDDVVVGSVIARILADGEAHASPGAADGPPAPAATGAGTAAPSAPSAQAAQSEPAAKATPAAFATSPAPAAPSSDDGSPRPAASPLARRTSRERGLDLAAITGTGPFGAVLIRDLADADAHTALGADDAGREADTAATGRSEEAAPGLSPALAPAGVALAELERRTDARALEALLRASGDVPIHAALAKFLAAVVRRRLAIDPSDGVTIQISGPGGQATVPHADRHSMVDLTERIAAAAGPRDAASDGAAPAGAAPEGAAPDAVLVHAGDLPIDAVRPVAAAPVALGLGRPAASADDPAPLTLTLRYDPARVDDAIALTMLTDLVRLVGDPAALAVAF